MTKSQAPHRHSQMGPRSTTTSTAKTAISTDFHQDSEPSKPSQIQTTRNSPPSNRRKRKRQTSNNGTGDKTTLTSRVRSRFEDYPGLLNTEESDVALISSPKGGVLQAQGPNLIVTGGRDRTESTLDFADDETVVRIRQDLIKLGIELRENARRQIRWISELGDLDRIHLAIDGGPFSSRD